MRERIAAIDPRIESGRPITCLMGPWPDSETCDRRRVTYEQRCLCSKSNRICDSESVVLSLPIIAAKHFEEYHHRRRLTSGRAPGEGNDLTVLCAFHGPFAAGPSLLPAPVRLRDCPLRSSR